MYLFDQKRAEAAYLTERARVDKIELAERLAGKAKTREQNGDTQGSSGSASTAETQTASPGTDSRDATDIISKTSEDEDLFGDMLEAPAEPSQTESSEPERNSAGTIIAVRDVGLPKNYAGKTPRLLLDDALRRLDKFAKVTYRVISRSRAIRAVATIRWDSGRLEQYGMEDEACETQEQAFNYAATLALFAVSQDGSAHRLLPAKFRDLWDELEGRQRDAEKAAYALQMKIYTALAEARRENAGPSATLKLAPGASATRQVELGAEQEAGPAMLNEPESAPQENLKEQLAQRQSLPSYQAMLVRRPVPACYTYG
jgi:ATP-dependent RNA helicase DHX29